MRRFVLRLLILCSAVVFLTSCGGGGGGSTPPVPVTTSINGGLVGSGPAGSLFIVEGTGFGTLSTAIAGYTVDFRDAATGSVIASAPGNYTVGDWTDAFIKATVPNGLNTSTTYKVTVTTAGGTSNAMDFMVVASVAFSPSTIAWSAATPTLPVAMQGFSSVVSTIVSTVTTTNYLYVIGGNTAPSATTAGGAALNTDAVYVNRLDNATGGLTVASWATATVLPAKRGFSAAVFANKFNSFVAGNGHIYVLGGLDDQGTAAATVYHAAVNDDGTLGAWAETSPLPQALFAHGAVLVRGRIYVAGGNDAAGNPVKTVYAAKVNSDGTLGAWAQLADLPDARAYHQFVSVAGNLYVIGGVNAAIDPLSNTNDAASLGSVYYAQVSLVDGSLVNAAWTANSNGPKARQKFSAIVAGGDIVVTGGLYTGTPGSSESQYAEVRSDGSMAPFNGATGTNTISPITGYNPYNQSTAFFADVSGKPHIIVLGGADATAGTTRSGIYISSQ